MVAPIGKDNEPLISKDVREGILSNICRYQHETGGIIGADEEGKIIAFQFDQIHDPALYEYRPNTEFLHQVLQNDWQKSGIQFAGFVHSHLLNDALSKADLEYARMILQNNPFLPSVLMGVIDLSQKTPDIMWYRVESSSVFKIQN